MKKTCPLCGEDFPKGGAYTNHVENCNADPSKSIEGEEVNKKVRQLQARVGRVEQELNKIPRGEKVELAQVEAEDAQETANKALSRANTADEKASEVEEKTVFACGNCGAEIPMPWQEPRKCENCGQKMNWKENGKRLRQEAAEKAAAER